MELSRRQKILLGAASAWPFAYILIFIAAILAIIVMANSGPGSGAGALGGLAFLVFIAIHLLTILLTLGLTVFYIIHAVKNLKLDSNMRIVWILLFFFGGMIAHPIYWYLEIWKVKPDDRFTGQLHAPPANFGAYNEYGAGAYVPPSEPPDWR
ncbi:hypothetical protein BH10ACI2_BH10ACI2_21780 [soil metagenome]